MSSQRPAGQADSQVGVDRLSVEERSPRPPGGGGQADDPTEVPPRGWWQIVRRALRRFSDEQGTLIAAGVAYYGFMALVPTLIAVVLLYGLISDPAQVQQQVDSLSSALPDQAKGLVTERLTALSSTSSGGLGIGLVVSLLVALWSASGGVSALMTAVNDAYGEDDDRGFVRKKALALALTVGAILFFCLSVALIAVLPAVLGSRDLPAPAEWGLQGARWLLLLGAVALALAVVYRVAPDRDAPRLQWLSVGAVVATVIWILATLGFSLYVAQFSSYDKTYGPMAGVVVILLWMWLSSIAVLLGATVNAEAERQTAKDTTVGSERALGKRDAYAADTVAGQ
ncbi:MAG: YihY/virulence factor BrkB family protein [Kineosporiaceae bacterium]